LFIIWATLKRILAMLRLNVFALLLITCTDFQKSPASEPSWWWKWKKGVKEGWGEIATMSYFCTESFWAKQWSTHRIFLFPYGEVRCYNPADFNQAVSMGLADELVVAYFHFLDHLWKKYPLETLGLIHFHLVSTFTYNMDWRKQLSSWQCCSWLHHPRTCKRLITVVIVFVP